MTTEAAGGGGGPLRPPAMESAVAAWSPPCSLVNINVEAFVNDCEEQEVSGILMAPRPFATVRCYC